ncbi:hypothetical protein E3P99_00745 [Wallemia hederae]|uniref:G-patch domain-containing protein n=1 Tax=Wallemia hederae TaxID=1540922 RepID=A0A4T0FVG9_9BASI|nr:hypothetical protein E3P99_00745 [Wallemia hederae]
MSLYGGIFYEEKEPEKVDEKSEEKSVEKEKSSPAPAPAPAQKPAQNWTSSLKFAPNVRRSKAAAKPVKPSLPIPSAFTSAAVSASSSNASTPMKGEGSEGRKGSKESVDGGELQQTSSSSSQPGPSSSTLAPPPMTISDNDDDDDDMQFSNRYRRVLTKKEKKMKRKGQLAAAGPAWHDDYDPYKPTDYAEYKRFAQFLKQERLARKADELQRQGQGQYSSSDDSDSDDQAERARNKMFAPPSAYDNDGAASASAPAPAPPPAPSAINLEESGDDVFQRRLAMSSATAQQARMRNNDDEENDAPQPQPQPQPQSQPQPQMNTPSEQFSDTSQQPQLPQVQEPHAPAISNPPSMPAQQDTQSSAQTPQDRLKASQAAAASIAAKFSKLVPQKPQLPAQLVPQPAQTQAASQSQASEVDDFLATIEDSTVSKEQQELADNKANFAQRFMAKQGWKQGEGLGAQKSGMTEALSLERTESGGGEIKSKEEGRLDREAKELFGEPSKCIILRNMVKLHEVDDDLSQEVADECNKNGIVERVVVHTPKEYSDESDAVKILVKFSGLVGAYKNVRALNGRYFGGAQIIAKYYPDEAFVRGIYDL